VQATVRTRLQYTVYSIRNRNRHKNRCQIPSEKLSLTQFKTQDKLLLQSFTQTNMEFVTRASKRFSWRRKQADSFSTFSSDVSLFKNESTACRAQASRESSLARRGYRKDRRKSRKNKIFESMAMHEAHVDIPGTAEESKQGKRPSVGPIKVTRDRTPFFWRKSLCVDIDGETVPSDNAYVDMLLEERHDALDYVTLVTETTKTTERGGKVFTHTSVHTVQYNGESIWKLETRRCFDVSGTWGQTSNCTLQKDKGILRVKLFHKGRKNMGQGWNSRETREYDLLDMIKESGKARKEDVL
jgi:hypothetical protein